MGWFTKKAVKEQNEELKATTEKLKKIAEDLKRTSERLAAEVAEMKNK